MGTRGLFGFRKNGIDKAVYHHFDSYPEGLGREFLTFVLKNKDKLEEYFDHIKVIDHNVKPTPEIITYCKKMGWYNDRVSNRSTDDWYCLVRGLQGLDQWQKCIDSGQDVYIDNRIDFIKDSLWCEYAYIYDVDRKVMEFYSGFQKEPDENNRYGTEKEDGYYPCKLLCAIPADDETVVEEEIEAMRKLAYGN